MAPTTNFVHLWIDKLNRAARSGEPLDLAPRTGADCDNYVNWPPERTVSAAALRAVLTDPDTCVDPRGLWIRGARFDTAIDLEHVMIPYPLVLLDCVLQNGFRANRAKMKSLIFVGVISTREVQLVGATIDGILAFATTALTDSDGCALSFNGAHIVGVVVMRDGLRAEGEIGANGVTIDGSLDFERSEISKPAGCVLGLSDARISGSLLLCNGFRAQGTIIGMGMAVGGLVGLQKASLCAGGLGALHIDNAVIGGGLFAQGCHVEGEVRADGAEIGGNLDLSDASLNNPMGRATPRWSWCARERPR